MWTVITEETHTTYFCHSLSPQASGAANRCSNIFQFKDRRFNMEISLSNPLICSSWFAFSLPVGFKWLSKFRAFSCCYFSLQASTTLPVLLKIIRGSKLCWTSVLPHWTLRAVERVLTKNILHVSDNYLNNLSLRCSCNSCNNLLS